MALVTIGIPVYNEERFLEKTILSALGQDLGDIRIVISDNGSTDGSPEIIRKYQRQDGRITAVFKKKNEGMLSNYYTLLDNTDTRYFVMMGAHDLFLPDYLRKAAAFLEANPDYVMAYPHSNFIDENDAHQGSSDSDIDTTGLCTRQRMRKVAEDLAWCTCIHGVFRTEIIRKIPVVQTRGNDQVMLFATAYHGHIRFLDGLGILRREWRRESSEAVEVRRISQGMYPETGSRFYDAYAVMSMEHLVFLFEKTTLPLWEKLALAMTLLPIFKRAHNTSVSSIALAYLNRGKK